MKFASDESCGKCFPCRLGTKRGEELFTKAIDDNQKIYRELLNDLFNDEIIVLEDIQGSKIWVNWDGAHFNIKPKSVSNESINLIDLAMQNYYNPAINYFNSLDGRIKSLLNKKSVVAALKYSELFQNIKQVLKTNS